MWPNAPSAALAWDVASPLQAKQGYQPPLLDMSWYVQVSTKCSINSINQFPRFCKQLRRPAPISCHCVGFAMHGSFLHWNEMASSYSVATLQCFILSKCTGNSQPPSFASCAMHINWVKCCPMPMPRYDGVEDPVACLMWRLGNGKGSGTHSWSQFVQFHCHSSNQYQRSFGPKFSSCGGYSCLVLEQWH